MEKNPRKCSVIRILQVLLLQTFCLCNLSRGLLLKTPASYDATVNIIQQRAAYLIEGYIEVEHELPLEELENTLDLISFKLNNLQYASDVTNYYPSILNFYEQNITIFQREIPLSITATLCRALDLPILTLDSVPYFNDSSYNILFDTEIIVKPREILCTGPSLYLKNDFCIA